MTPISLDAAAVVTESSKSTWRRRIADGVVTKLDVDGKRTMLALADVAPLITIRLAEEDLKHLAAADTGSAEAQDDMGQFFLAAGKHEAAMYWLEQAARQDYPNAMQTMGRCYASGVGVPKDENLAIRWLARAAAHGHVIAQAHMQALRGSGATCFVTSCSHRRVAWPPSSQHIRSRMQLMRRPLSALAWMASKRSLNA